MSMTTKFNAEFIDVEAIESRIVTSEGRVTGLSKFKGREVKIVVLEEPSSCATITYGAGIDGGVPVPRRSDHGAFSNVPDGEAHIDPMSLHTTFVDLADSDAHIEGQTI